MSATLKAAAPGASTIRGLFLLERNLSLFTKEVLSGTI